MHHGNPAGLVEVGMTVFIRGRPVGGPARMTDAGLTGDSIGLENLGETFVDLPLFLFYLEFLVAEDGDARAVVAAILEPSEALQNDGGGLLFSDITNDAAHEFFLI